MKTYIGIQPYNKHPNSPLPKYMHGPVPFQTPSGRWWMELIDMEGKHHIYLLTKANEDAEQINRDSGLQGQDSRGRCAQVWQALKSYGRRLAK